VNLGINSTQSRNLSSGRTFEIPASGAFMLAARTIEHQMFFEEDKEAVFFDSPEELVDKAIYYLRNEAARQAIAEAGHRRCVTSGYSWRELMGGMATLAERNL
jgi:spore maturation protein CgeB